MLLKRITNLTLLTVITIYSLGLPLGILFQNLKGSEPVVNKALVVTTAKEERTQAAKPTQSKLRQSGASIKQPVAQSTAPANPGSNKQPTAPVTAATTVPKTVSMPAPVKSTVSTQATPPPTQPTQNRAPYSSTKSDGSAVSNYQFQMLARIISAEAKGESLEGQVAVGAVILNRVKSGKFPDNIAANVLKRGQFEPVANGQIWNEPTQSAVRAARLALNGWDPTNGALYFFNPAKSSSRWIWSRKIITQIGDHLFAV